MSSCCGTKKKKFDYLLWGALVLTAVGYSIHLLNLPYFETYSMGVFELLNRMFVGLLIGIFFAGLISKIPQQMLAVALGSSNSFKGILRATAAGVLLDLCSHGILLVGMKLYKKGASLGQTMAFLIASPWNSLSLTLILWSLIGFWWMLAFLLLSMIMAIISGLIFDHLENRGVLPKNPSELKIEKNYRFWSELKKLLFKTKNFYPKNIFLTFYHGLQDSKMILKWVFVGTVLASLIRSFASPEQFESLFGPTLLGLALTLIAATIIEVCSEGSTPIAADIFNRAHAPGNSFAFLMAGVSTDYTEIMSLKETTKSWKISLFLPLVTLPQVILISYLINTLS